MQRLPSEASPCPERLRWSDIFSVSDRRKVGHCGGKTLPADQIMWWGIFEGRRIRAVSTVRLIMGGLAHFSVNSGARIGCHDWGLPGGYYIDLMFASRDRLSDEDLMRLGTLAAAEDTRPVSVRRKGELLAQARAIPASGL